MNINKAILNANDLLRKNNIKSAKLDSEILMAKAIDKKREYIILNSDNQLTKKNYEYYQHLINQRLNGKPIAYILGKKDFWKYEFKIMEGVLIPRPDSELIVEHVLNFANYKSKLNILDIGVGSGCLLLSILKEKKDFYGTGIDISQKSLDISNINAEKLNLQNRVKFFKSDIDNFNYGKYDLIISNPPYINKQRIKYLERDVREFEPKSALNGGIDGLSRNQKSN
tara:strand:- start:1478 stop:2155 length:678 start_codon:yes stop_codon:yes gene_type:complete